MTPRQHAEALMATPYFDRIESYALLYGYLVSTPTAYVLAMPAHSSQSLAQILNISAQTWRMTTQPDMLHIWCAVGDMEELVGWVCIANPDGIQFLSFERFDNKHRIIPLKKFIYTVMGSSPPTPPKAPPPVTSTNKDALAVAEAAKRKQRGRTNFASTILAPPPTAGKETLG